MLAQCGGIKEKPGGWESYGLILGTKNILNILDFHFSSWTMPNHLLCLPEMSLGI